MTGVDHMSKWSYVLQEFAVNGGEERHSTVEVCV